MKVAFATTDGVTVDEHFGRAGQFAIYEFNPEATDFAFLEMRTFSEGRDTAIEQSRGNEAEHERLVQSKVEKLADCRLIFIEQIGGPSAARLSRKGIMPLKVKDVLLIQENLAKLSETIRSNPPMWLRKALNQ